MSFEVATALAKQGLYVFPVTQEKRPFNEHGLTDATIDPEIIRGWWSKWPSARVGIHMSKSGLVGLDIDCKNGVNGFWSIEMADLIIPVTDGWDTPSGGRHHVYKAPEGVRLGPAREYRGLEGVDRRGGASYLVYYPDTVDGEFFFADAPEWLCDEVKVNIGAQFDGGLDVWLESLGGGAPDFTMQKAIDKFPTSEFGHSEMIEHQFHIVRLVAEGRTGGRIALDRLRDLWLVSPWDTPDYEYEFDAGLHSAVQKYGALDEFLANLPAYNTVLDRLLEVESFDESLLFGERDKSHYFTVLRALVNTPLSDSEIASILYGAPATKQYATSWGSEYLQAQIKEARQTKEHLQNEAREIAESYNLEVDFGVEPTFNSWVDRYVALAKASSAFINEPYHRHAAWMILSMAVGRRAYIDIPGQRPMGLNLYGISLGPSSTGKSIAHDRMLEGLQYLFEDEPDFNLGDAMSAESLQKRLLERGDNASSIVLSDEAAAFFASAGRDWNTALMTRLTQYYGGYVPPQGRVKMGENEKRGVNVSLTVAMWGTPDKVTNLLNEGMFDDGGLARVLWSWGDPVEGDHRHRVSFSDEPTRVGQAYLPEDYRELLDELLVFRPRTAMRPVRVKELRTAIMMLEAAVREMFDTIDRHPKSAVLEAPVMRLKDSVRKAAALLAVTEWSDDSETPVVTDEIMARALYQAEEWFRSAVRAVEAVSASEFQRQSMRMLDWLRAQGRAVSLSKFHRQFGQFDTFTRERHLQDLLSQGYIVQNDKQLTLNEGGN